jgi:urocanate reductase
MKKPSSHDNATPENSNRRNFIKRGVAVTLGSSMLGSLIGYTAFSKKPIKTWDRSVDVVIAGGGTSGLSAAIEARDNNASVLIVESNYDCGGHGLVSGGRVNLGGGTSRQRRHGIEDTAEQVFNDWIQPSNPESRYSDRDLVRVYANLSAETFEWMIENGVQFQDEVAGRDNRNGRTLQWPIKNELVTTVESRRGSGLVRALEKSARNKGAEILLLHEMKDLIVDESGKVIGILVSNQGETISIEGRKGVILATGGHTSDVEFRRMFDPRLTEEYQVAGEPYSKQTADGERAAMAIGAALWGTASQTMEAGNWISKTAHIGCQWGYSSLHWPEDSPIFDKIRASGLTRVNWQNAIMVKQNGKRFHDEMDGGHDFYNACLSYSGDPNKLNGGGPVWAIFDADAVLRQRWNPTPPHVDPRGYFFSGDTLFDLANEIKNPYQSLAMSSSDLQETVSRYNTFVDSGIDVDFGKRSPRYKIEKPPFYAAWATPILHDSLCGLRVDSQCQVMTVLGDVIEGLYCCGESMGGFAQHGLGRCALFGRVAGKSAAVRS